MIKDWEIKCILGKGHFSAGHMLRNLAKLSRWRELFLACATRIDELEKENAVLHLLCEERSDRISDMAWVRAGGKAKFKGWQSHG